MSYVFGRCSILGYIIDKEKDAYRISKDKYHIYIAMTNQKCWMKYNSSWGQQIITIGLLWSSLRLLHLWLSLYITTYHWIGMGSVKKTLILLKKCQIYILFLQIHDLQRSRHIMYNASDFCIDSVLEWVGGSSNLWSFFVQNDLINCSKTIALKRKSL